MAAKKSDPFARVRSAARQLSLASGKPRPKAPSERGGVTPEDRIQFIRDCFSWYQDISTAYGWRNKDQPTFADTSLLGALLEPVHGTGEAASDDLGEPPSELLAPDQWPGHWSVGLEPLTQGDLRNAVEGLPGMINRFMQEPEPLADAEIWGIVRYADVWVTHSPIHWKGIVEFLKVKLTRAKSLALQLVQWLDLALHQRNPSRADVNRRTKKQKRAWVDKALLYISENMNVSAQALARLVGVSASTITRHPLLGKHFKKRPIGQLGEDVGAEVLDRDSSVLTKDKLPAVSTRRRSASS